MNIIYVHYLLNIKLIVTIKCHDLKQIFAFSIKSFLKFKHLIIKLTINIKYIIYIYIYLCIYFILK